LIEERSEMVNKKVIVKGINHLHSKHHQTLEEKRQTTLATGKATIEQTNTGNDQPDQKGTNSEIDVVKLISGVLRIHVRLYRVTTSGVSRVEHRLV